MDEPTDPRGRGRRDPETGLYEWYDLEYETTRTTSDKLQAVLNGLAPEQELVSAHFQGGRDWTVISRARGLRAADLYRIRDEGLRGVEGLEILRKAARDAAGELGL